MRPLLFCTLLLFTALAIASRKPKEKVDEKDFAALSGRFLAALQSEKLEDCMACWASVGRLKQLMENPPEGVPKPPAEEIKQMVKYFEERDKIVKQRFPKFIKALKANNVTPNKLTYVKSSGEVDKKGDFEQANYVNMVFKHEDGTLVELSVDDGFKLDGKWYFSDKPHPHIVFVKKGKRETVWIADDKRERDVGPRR